MRVLSAGEPMENDADQQQDHGVDRDRNKREPEPQVRHGRTPDNRSQRRGPAGRMERSGQ